MLIVDAQIHLWSQGIPTNALHWQILSYSAEECLMEMNNGGVRAALIHPPGWDPNSLVVAESAAVRYPDRFAILGRPLRSNTYGGLALASASCCAAGSNTTEYDGCGSGHGGRS